MKIKFLSMIILAILLTGCAPAIKNIPSLADDVGRFTSRYGDEIIKTSQQYTDEIARQPQYSDEALRYWDDIVHSSQAVDDSRYVLLYRNLRLSPLQDDFVLWLRNETGMDQDTALLYLQAVCFVAEAVKTKNEYPTQLSTELYVQRVASANHTSLAYSIADFAASVREYTASLIEREDADFSGQEEARLLFEGLCLVSEVVK